MQYNIGDKVEFVSGGYVGRITMIYSGCMAHVEWADGTDSMVATSQLKEVYKSNRFNFVIFKNYDGTSVGKLIPRETYQRLTSA